MEVIEIIIDIFDQDYAEEMYGKALRDEGYEEGRRFAQRELLIEVFEQVVKECEILRTECVELSACVSKVYTYVLEQEVLASKKWLEERDRELEENRKKNIM